ncbi:RagB/SusD family nutrient uptake outer membrane protein [Cellulophaga baltica]|uniref:RagB/SusD family nutrient uptake outer membrane protein n=1 Tax=Cellulophaga baltica TaxID=76594 RepID=UPI0037C70D98
MKNIIYIIVFAFFISLSSCSIDNVEPKNVLLESNAITNETTALGILNRIYNSGLRNSIYGRDIGGGAGVAIVENISLSSLEIELLTPSTSFTAFNTNNVLNNEDLLQQVYVDLYFNINLSNYFIELVERGDANVNDSRKNELLAEAKFFRGLSHFSLLRIFGQFYDVNSPLGVVVSTQPIRSNTSFPRNSVQETYDAIIADLQFSADNAPTGRAHYYVSATTAQALLAKVQLNMGDYTNAALNAQAVISNTDGYLLEPTYSGVFNDRWGAETLLAAYVDIDIEGAQAHNFGRNTFGPSTLFRTLADEQDGLNSDGSTDNATGYDPRYSLGFYLDPANPTILIGKYPFDGTFAGGEGNAIKTLRMAEIYLIYAEAEARRDGGSLANALARVNEIRNRAGASVTPRVLSDKATLLEDIRIEKMLELYCETGENWYDLVRYDRLGDIDASALKPSISSVNKLIFPIPNAAIIGNTELVPNP